MSTGSLATVITVVAKDLKEIWIVTLNYPAIKCQSTSVDFSKFGSIIINVVYCQKVTIAFAATGTFSSIMVNYNFKAFSAISSTVRSRLFFLFL
jgi:hypothetical protein